MAHGSCLHDGFLRNGVFKSKTLFYPAYKQIFTHIEYQMQENGMLDSEKNKKYIYISYA